MELNEYDIKRFWRHVRKTDTCWLWIGSVTRKGYGRFFLNGKIEHAHRVAIEIAGIQLGYKSGLHKCNIKNCVRYHSEHVYVGTQTDNMQDLVASGNHASTKVIMCPKGHNSWSNILNINGHSARRCKECYNEYMRNYRNKTKLG